MEELARGALVLVVDNDPLMVRLVSEMLKLGGYRTLEASSPERAVELFERNQKHVDLLLSDVAMPGMTGRELSACLCAEKPGLVVLLMSADEQAPDCGLHKPFGMDELHLRVAEALK